MKQLSLLLLFQCAINLLLSAQELPRKAWFGAQLQDWSEDANGGCEILGVYGGTSEALGLQAGDVIVKSGKSKIGTSAEFIAEFTRMKTGDPIQLEVLRAKSKLKLKGSIVGRALETDDNSEVIYSQADFRGGQLRVIINKPPAAGKLPAMLFIPGYTCSSIDNLPDYHPYKRIVDAYVDAGYVTLRIEKSGLGDSRNTPECESCSLLDEIENFEVGLKKLQGLKYVDPEKIIIVGHSMGGIVAPALSARHPVAGVVVFGTTAKSWFEYQLEMYRVQNELAGMNPIEVEESVRAQYDLNYRFFVEKESLESMAEDPSSDSLLRAIWQYDGNGRIYSRNYEYWRQIQDLPLLENWKNTEAKVLVQYGESDFQAFSKADHLQIVNTVNHFHPSNATFISFPETDHYFARSGSMQEAYDKFANGQYMQLFEEYNPEVGNSAVEWSNRILSEALEPDPKRLSWRKLQTESYPGKQDDICFVNPQEGWYVNGYGNIYHTQDGGESWENQLQRKGSFFRCIAFTDSLRGFAGTVGTDYFPNVTDTIPLYETRDGGKTWKAVEYDGPYVKGLCAIDIVREQYINHGEIDYRNHLYAVGKVGSPANLMVSHDNGDTWISQPVNEGEMLFDITMFDINTGIACSASGADISQSNALILKTYDGGKSWKKVYQSKRPFETTWKASFPSPEVGYVTIQSYNPDPSVKQQRVAKTVDGGETWVEIDLIEDAGAREFGIGFIDELHGFVGTMNSGYETRDGGESWEKVDLGRACNKIRIYRDGEKTYGFAIGVDVLILE